MRVRIYFTLTDIAFKRKTVISLERAYGNLVYRDKEGYGVVLKSLYTGEYCEYYELHSTFLSAEKMYFILKPLYLDDAIEITNAILSDYDISDDEKLIEVFKEHLVDKITEYVQDELADELTETVSHIISNTEESDIAAFMSETSSNLEDAVWSVVEDLACEKIEEHITKIDESLDISDKDFDISDMRYYLDISGAITSELKADYDEDNDRSYTRPETDTSLVVAMFER